MRYTTAERFTNEFLAALQARDIDAFKAALPRATTSCSSTTSSSSRARSKTEEEFFHTFNALYDAGSQLVLTSDRLPRDLDALEDRLRERFEAGLVTDIAPPDLATRIDDPAQARPARRHRRRRRSASSTSIADRIDGNVRALEGALIRVVAYASLTGAAAQPRPRRRGPRRPLPGDCLARGKR